MTATQTPTRPEDHPAFRDLLKAVCERPDDDLPRLVAADWLDENGESARAEFVRVQIEMAKLSEPDLKTIGRISFGDDRDVGWRHGGLCTRCRETACRYHALENRQTELAATRFEEWFPGLRELIPMGDDCRQYITRGFPSRIECSLQAFMGGPCSYDLRAAGGYGARNIPCARTTCKKCNGTGRLPGLVDTVGAKWPITEVRLTDRDPHEIFHHRAGHVDSEGILVTTTRFGFWPDSIPFFDCNQTFPTIEAAHSALSSAIIDLSRERCGLGKLKGVMA